MASSTTPTRRTRAGWTPPGACTSGSTARHAGATRPARTGGAATTSTRATDACGRRRSPRSLMKARSVKTWNSGSAPRQRRGWNTQTLGCRAAAASCSCTTDPRFHDESASGCGGVPQGRCRMHRQLQRGQVLFLALLLILAAASWALLIWLSRTAQTMSMGLTMGMGAALFLAIWVVMMVAMMFPATAPMNLTFARVQRERHGGGRAFVPTWVFVGAYLLIWTLFGALAYLG